MSVMRVGVLALLALALSGCAAVQNSGPQAALIRTGDQTIVLDGCKPDLMTLWHDNATIKTGTHLVTVDEHYLTVDGQFIRRPAFKVLTIHCARDAFSVSVDGKNFADMVKRN